MNSPEESSADRLNRRNQWLSKRIRLEKSRIKHYRYGTKRKSRWSLFEQLIRFFGIFLKTVRLYDRGIANAKNVSIREIVTTFPDLPPAFHGYTILHLTDLHLDTLEDFEEVICDTIGQVSCDLCVLTGDYREKTSGDFHQILKPLGQIVKTVKARDGILGVLGNHDTARMANSFDKLGITLLANETIILRKGEDRIAISGIDDPHYYYTDQAIAALNRTYDCFKIGLIHTPELYDVAADRGYRLYLCGHTHGGQICLPGGPPVITHLYAGKKYSRGLWRHKNMIGFTNSGCGVVGIPIRFNCPGEIALIRLMREIPS